MTSTQHEPEPATVSASELQTEYEPSDRPDWINDTPDRVEEYQLAMFVRSDAYQFLYLSREEYIALKTHLAKMRGFDVKPEEKAA